jgi:hypothetical protein
MGIISLYQTIGPLLTSLPTGECNGDAVGSHSEETRTFQDPRFALSERLPGEFRVILNLDTIVPDKHAYHGSSLHFSKSKQGVGK